MATRKIEPERNEQDEVPIQPRLTTKEAVETANTALLEQVFREKQDKNCWTAQAITSTALGDRVQGYPGAGNSGFEQYEPMTGIASLDVIHEPGSASVT